MTEPAKSSEALSGVVMGKAAGAALAGARSGRVRVVYGGEN